MPKSVAKRGLIHKAAKRGDGGQVSALPPGRQGVQDISGIKNKEVGRPEVWGIWGKMAGKRCGNSHSSLM